MILKISFAIESDVLLMVMQSCVLTIPIRSRKGLSVFVLLANWERELRSVVKSYLLEGGFKQLARSISLCADAICGKKLDKYKPSEITSVGGPIHCSVKDVSTLFAAL